MKQSYYVVVRAYMSRPGSETRVLDRAAFTCIFSRKSRLDFTYVLRRARRYAYRGGTPGLLVAVQCFTSPAKRTIASAYYLEKNQASKRCISGLILDAHGGGRYMKAHGPTACITIHFHAWESNKCTDREKFPSQKRKHAQKWSLFFCLRLPPRGAREGGESM